ncbi:MAG: hypothetical protein DMG57_14125 [Acidobacteria bacterium]|nr:MAG: hypothetical protein DMG57_14125 [Acidobacteriota bacterium]
MPSGPNLSSSKAGPKTPFTFCSICVAPSHPTRTFASRSGIAYTQLHDLAQAEKFYRKAVELNPQFWAPARIWARCSGSWIARTNPSASFKPSQRCSPQIPFHTFTWASRTTHGGNSREQRDISKKRGP